MTDVVVVVWRRTCTSSSTAAAVHTAAAENRYRINHDTQHSDGIVKRENLYKLEPWAISYRGPLKLVAFRRPTAAAAAACCTYIR